MEGRSLTPTRSRPGTARDQSRLSQASPSRERSSSPTTTTPSSPSATTLSAAQQPSSSADQQPPISFNASQLTPSPSKRLNSTVITPSNDRVRVSVRIRPRSPLELSLDAPSCLLSDFDRRTISVSRNHWERISETLECDALFNESASQRRVYETVALPVVQSVMGGVNGTVLADVEYETSVTLSYLQLYMEAVHDLLAADAVGASGDVGSGLSVYDNPATGEVEVPGAMAVSVTGAAECLEIIERANSHRINASSSRSHAVLFLNVLRKPTGVANPESNQPASVTILYPLTPLHSPLPHPGSEGRQADEAKAINLSLTALGKCVRSLSLSDSHVPFRDSKLTRLLRDSFGGGARTSLVVCVSDVSEHAGETAAALQFGGRAMCVENGKGRKEGETDFKLLAKRQQLLLASDSLSRSEERARAVRAAWEAEGAEAEEAREGLAREMGRVVGAMEEYETREKVGNVR
eukprot:jgi/Chlat1/5328/Chrsp35S05259